MRVRQSLAQQLEAQAGVEVAALTKCTSTVEDLIAAQGDALTAEADDEERLAAEELAAALPTPLPPASPAASPVVVVATEDGCCSACHAQQPVVSGVEFLCCFRCGEKL